MKRALLSALLAPLAACPQPQHSCAATMDDARFVIHLSSDDWAPGDYVFSLTGEREQADWTVTLPLADGADADSPMITYDAEGYPTQLVALDIQAPTVDLAVSRDGVEIAAQSFTPDYTITPQDNGCDNLYNAEIDWSW